MDIQFTINNKDIKIYDINIDTLNCKVYEAILKHDLNHEEIISLVGHIKEVISYD